LAFRSHAAKIFLARAPDSMGARFLLEEKKALGCGDRIASGLVVWFVIHVRGDYVVALSGGLEGGYPATPIPKTPPSGVNMEKH